MARRQESGHGQEKGRAARAERKRSESRAAQAGKKGSPGRAARAGKRGSAQRGGGSSKCKWKHIAGIGMVTLLGVAMLFLLCLGIGSIADDGVVPEGYRYPRQKTKEVERPKMRKEFLTKNKYSRPGIPLEQVNGVVIHYTANPGTDAEGNRNYFEGLKDSKATKASSHFIIGLNGTIVECVPLREIAYASNERNEDTISIECCHPDETGKFTDETYDALIALTAWLCGRYDLKEEDIIRHYDVTGKDCPRYYVAHEDEWEELKEDVFRYIEANAIAP